MILVVAGANGGFSMLLGGKDLPGVVRTRRTCSIFVPEKARPKPRDEDVAVRLKDKVAFITGARSMWLVPFAEHITERRG